MKLTKSQKEALEKFSDGKWHSAYDVQSGLNTLNALFNKGLLDRKAGLGSMAFPRNGIKFKLKENGDG
ncbi:MAG: hypothetical protein CML17_02350 [Pusillimonas sp.]|jgi:hypothetical protein|nr:hypothetical protein [Pusillimonas sp.]|tara:strand:+ start:3038 stop:3241 length:204 start_codon:yes stop_codon:yes gene_type:complete